MDGIEAQVPEGETASGLGVYLSPEQLEELKAVVHPDGGGDRTENPAEHCHQWALAHGLPLQAGVFYGCNFSDGEFTGILPAPEPEPEAVPENFPHTPPPQPE